MGLLDEQYDPYNRPNDQPTDQPSDNVPPPLENGWRNTLLAPGVTAPAVSQPVATPTVSRGGGGGGGFSEGAGFQGPAFGFKPVPKFDAPAFVRPDAQSILGAPGFQARLQAGEGALQRSAASKGLLRSGGTFKDLIEYGQNFASNEYNNNFNQALQTHQANYQIAKDKYAPLLAEWDTLSKGEIQRGLAAYNRGTIWNNPHAGGGGGGGYSESLEGPCSFGLC